MSKKFEGSVAPRERINISYVDGQILDLEQRTVLFLHGQHLGVGVVSHNVSPLPLAQAVRLFGSRASLTASPIMMNASTVMASAADG